MKIIIVLLLAVFFSLPGASSFADSVTLKTIVFKSSDQYTNTPGTANSVTDNETGLIWIKNPTTIGTVGGYNFSAVMLWPEALLAIAALNAANSGAGYDGSNQWRLPNVKELQSIVDYSRDAPYINPIFFISPPTIRDFYPATTYYWSSTTSFYGLGYEWCVNFSDGGVAGGRVLHEDKNYVRPVRDS